jgi:hypothetical protein
MANTTKNSYPLVVAKIHFDWPDLDHSNYHDSDPQEEWALQDSRLRCDNGAWERMQFWSQVPRSHNRSGFWEWIERRPEERSDRTGG